MESIKMVDLKNQYQHIKNEIDSGIQQVINESAFINGQAVKDFRISLKNYIGAKHAVTCGNGTDALQIALMALGLQPDDEVIIPAFTYVATAEVIALLKLTPVLVDVNPDTFNIDPSKIETVVTNKTKAIIPVHLFGQSSDMEPIMKIAEKHKLFVIEDNAQAIGACYTFSDGRKTKAGTIGHIGCTSFFPSKNLGCYCDGGAIFTNDDSLGEKIQIIANHGQNKKYHHKYIGVNSRLDSVQAAVLNAKLPHLDEYNIAREQAAGRYDNAFAGVDELITPKRISNSTHVFHQYTLRIRNGKRDALKTHLAEKGVPSMIYYPMPLHEQEAYKALIKIPEKLDISETLCKEVLSLPMHSELTQQQENYIIEAVRSFFIK